ncbi:hypothetical protein [Gloeobacter violaceus]|uniref:Glr2503 protein n=1 Tax=Gloeobacter violaceus (strain ATCC 29082 / PCC 7421) TaxID=251221 RepID=Q7NHN2_GLOVI|nr:hypothetical protein [Gloeobacter violaceus]BAC90444.1 glr2503 [Gloeobacter violaceus PCC 7421]
MPLQDYGAEHASPVWRWAIGRFGPSLLRQNGGTHLRKVGSMVSLCGTMEVLPNISKKDPGRGQSVDSRFGVNVTMNISRRFAIAPEGRHFFVAVGTPASPQEPANPRPPGCR